MSQRTALRPRWCDTGHRSELRQGRLQAGRAGVWDGGPAGERAPMPRDKVRRRRRCSTPGSPRGRHLRAGPVGRVRGPHPLPGQGLGGHRAGPERGGGAPTRGVQRDGAACRRRVRHLPPSGGHWPLTPARREPVAADAGQEAGDWRSAPAGAYPGATIANLAIGPGSPSRTTRRTRRARRALRARPSGPRVLAVRWQGLLEPIVGAACGRGLLDP